jgi:membrane protein implicated in regulation of membrane protease activity
MENGTAQPEEEVTVAGMDGLKLIVKKIDIK